MCMVYDYHGLYHLHPHYTSATVTFGLHFTMQIHWTASFPIFFLLTPKPMYDTIWRLLLVRYDLVDVFVRYDLSTVTCTISISEPHIL